MCKKINWEQTFETGIDTIDEQHKRAIEIVNEVYNSVGKNKTEKTIIELIEKLDFYTNLHFKTEELYMKKYDFEDYSKHKKAHDYFKETYEQIRYSYFYMGNRKSPYYKLVNTYALHLSSILMDWLDFHLNTYDKDLAIFIKTKRNPTP